jgi:prepilin-type N-terminal cleavage/methylation domain-containing protein
MNASNRIYEEGFTLLEILIAVFIFSIILYVIYASYTGTFRIMDDTESQADVYGRARIALERMVEDLGSAYLSDQAEFRGEDKELDGRHVDALDFVSRAHLGLDEADTDDGPVEISYHVEESADGEGLILYRSQMVSADTGKEEGQAGWVLCEDLYSLNFTYYDENGEMHDSWDTKDPDLKGRLPAMVSIVLEIGKVSEGSEPLKFMTGVVLPLAGK